MSEGEAKEEAKNSIYHDFDISEKLLWKNIRKESARLPEEEIDIEKSLKQVITHPIKGWLDGCELSQRQPFKPIQNLPSS